MIEATATASNATAVSDSNDPTNCGVNVRGRMTNATAIASGGVTATGISGFQSQTRFSNLSFVMTGASHNARAIAIGQRANLSIRNSYFEASGGVAQNVGIWGIFGGSATIDGSTLIGSGPGSIIEYGGAAPGTMLIGASRLDGGPVQVGGVVTLTCAGVYDGAYNFYASTCP